MKTVKPKQALRPLMIVVSIVFTLFILFSMGFAATVNQQQYLASFDVDQGTLSLVFAPESTSPASSVPSDDKGILILIDGKCYSFGFEPTTGRYIVKDGISTRYSCSDGQIELR